MNQLTKHVQPTSWAEAKQLAKDISRSDLVPKQYRGFPDQILCAMQYGAEIGLSPFQALQSINIINGNATLSGDAMLALVSTRPECEGVAETFDGEGNDRKAICEVKRRGWKKPVVCTFSVADAKTAGLWGKMGPWKNYPDRMLQMRARGFALRNSFQDALKGFISSEEAGDYDVKISAPVAEAEVKEIAPFNAEESPAPPVVEPIIKLVEEADVPFTEEPQSDPHPKDPDVALITAAQLVGLENFIELYQLDQTEMGAYLKEAGYPNIKAIPKTKVSEFVKGLVAHARALKPEVTRG